MILALCMQIVVLWLLYVRVGRESPRTSTSSVFAPAVVSVLEVLL